ncbi:conjugative transfer relaxase/helicase TraI [Aeromonas salmonicida]|uniref:conjugative transfer relaxase/helicase TraI n=1 Tax=Aeromonas salmonicida TaxID=645 RepID=UPI000B3F9474|nr:conjugative transfer relaxase/helicase TraI [Aeromonas salmonicida]ARW85439.1 conjugative transfer relaxase/helicase TraI [Aeromonas salmonicida]
MLSLSTIKGGAAYYAAEENYYAMGELESAWLGEGAQRLGLDGPVDGATFDAIAQGKLPDGTELSRMVNGKETHRTGYDLTFSAPKSVSVLGLVAGDERFVAAHHRAVATAMKEVETLASTRIMTDGVSRTEHTGNIVAALYTHDTSRELDPQLHTHALVLNATYAEGKWRALSSDAAHMNTGFGKDIFNNKLALGGIYRHSLRQEVEAMGFETEITGKHGLWEIKGVPTQPFSQRSQQINDAVGPDASPQSRDVATLDTRRDKAVADPDLLIADWRDRLGKEGFDLPLFIAKADERAASHTQAPSPEHDLNNAVSHAISLLSDKKVQFSYSELLAATVTQLPAEPGIIKQARDGIDHAIEHERLIPLDKEKGIFTSDIHLLNELSVSQLAKELSTRPPITTFPQQAQPRDRPYADAYSVLAQDKAPLAILSGRGGMAQTIERMEDAVLMAHEQGRAVTILASDNRSAGLLAQNEQLAGNIAPRHTLSASTVFTPHSTLIVEQAETLTLKDTVLLLEKARASDVQLLLLDSERQRGVGNALSVLKQADVPQYRFYDAPKIQAAVISEPDKPNRLAALAEDYVNRLQQGEQVTAQISGSRDQQQLTSEIRSALRGAGQLSGPESTVNVLSPVWLDSKTRHQRDTYREGMVMEKWDDSSKAMQRYRIDRVADKTHSLVLANDQGERQSIKIRTLDSSWSLFETGSIALAAGDTLRVLGREAQGALKAQDTLTVLDATPGQVRVSTPTGEMQLATDRALKLSHNYVTGIGTTASKEGTVLAALSARQMSGMMLNQLARSGEHLTIYTPLEQERAESKLASHPQFQLASEKVKAHGDNEQLDTALKQATDRLFSPAEQAIHLGLAQVEARGIVFSTPDLLSAALDFSPATPVNDIAAALEAKLTQGDFIPVPGKSGDVVSRTSFEMEKTIIATMAQGKGAATPYLDKVPDNMLEGLTPGQAQSTRLILESDDQFLAIQGYAGVGKTTQFKAVLAALDSLPAEQRPTVVGIGPTHRAVHEMQSTGVKAQTLASFLSESRQQAMAGLQPDHSNTLFLVDESSMIGNRDMAEFYQRVGASGARVISSGDTAQLKAISSGAPFQLMQERSAIDVAVMKEIVRQLPELKPAIYSLIEGNLSQSLVQREAVQPDVIPRDNSGPDTWVPERSVIEADNPGQLVVSDYVGRTRLARENTMVIVHLNQVRHEINGAIHQALFDKGELGNRQTTLTILDPVRIEENSLRSSGLVEGNELQGKVAVLDQQYYTVSEVNSKDGTMILTDAKGKARLISNIENTAHDLAIYQPRDINVSEGDKIRFTRTVNEHGHVANSQWQVKRIEDNGSIVLHDGNKEKTVRPGQYQEDQHIDLGYAITAYGSQGASSQYAIELQAVKGVNKNLITLSSAYVPASRAKEHMQTYTDDKEAWIALLNKNIKGQVSTAHDALSPDQGKGQKLATELMANASPMRATALGRHVLKTHQLDEQQHMGKYIAPGKKYPTPHAAFPVWDKNGKQAGAVMVELRSLAENKGPTLNDDFRLVANDRAEFIGLQRASNGETRIAPSLEQGIKLAAVHPQSGILVSINGETNPFNVHRMTGGKLIVPDEYKSMTTTDSERDMPIPEDKLDKEVKRQEEIIKALAKEHDQKEVALPEDKQPDTDDKAARLARDVENYWKDANLSERQLREIADIKSEAKVKFTAHMKDTLDKVERDIVKELTLGE